MITTTMPEVGDRVLAYTFGTPSFEGQPTTITRIVGTRMTGEFASAAKPDDTVEADFYRYEQINPEVSVGDKVIGVRVIGIPHCEGRTGTVIDVYGQHANDPYVQVDFGKWDTADGREFSHQSWNVVEWAKAPKNGITFNNRDDLIGTTVKVIYASGQRGAVGTIGKVTETYFHQEPETYGPKIDGITIRVEGVASWVQAYDVIEDGQTLTVSNDYTPTVGERVKVTGYLDDTGILDGQNWLAEVTAVDGGIWMVRHSNGAEYASGPGYVFPAEKPIITRIVGSTPASQEEMVPRRELDRANQRVTEYSDRATKWEHDFHTVTNAVMEEAIERDWCEEYERVMDGISGDLLIGEIPSRRKTRVAVRRRISGTVTYYATVWVDEGNESTLDTDEMYSDGDADSTVGYDFVHDSLNDAYENNGFDDTDIDTV